MSSAAHPAFEQQLAQAFASARGLTPETPWDEKRRVLDEWFAVLLRSLDGELDARAAECAREFVMDLSGWGEHFVEVYLDARLQVERGRVSGSDSDAPPTPTCKLCDNDRWFRLAGQPMWVCSRCHPPVQPDASLEFWPPDDAEVPS